MILSSLTVVVLKSFSSALSHLVSFMAQESVPKPGASPGLAVDDLDRKRYHNCFVHMHISKLMKLYLLNMCSLLNVSYASIKLFKRNTED